MIHRYSSIAEYYNKFKSPVRTRHEYKDNEESSCGSISPLSVIYYPNRTRFSMSPSNEDINESKCSVTPNKYKHLSAQTTIFEDIMMNTTVLDGIRMGKLHHVIHQCTASDIANFFPIMYVF